MKRETHCGVLEFVADEGRIYIPYWVRNSKYLTLYQTTKLKSFADDKLNIVKMMISLPDEVENTVGKGENAGLLVCQNTALCGNRFTLYHMTIFQTGPN